MTENKKNNNKNSLIEGNFVQIIDESISKDEALLGFNKNNKISQKKENENKKLDYIKSNSQNLKNSITFCKAQTQSRYLDNKRYDKFGNLITKGGKYKISFSFNLVEVIKIDSYKEFNKMEEVKPNNGNGCCLII